MVGTTTKPRGIWQIYNGAIYRRRQEGATLQEIANEVGGVSRERIRQILVKHYGSTEVEGLLTSRDLAGLIGASVRTIQNYAKRGVLRPLLPRRSGRHLLFRAEESLPKLLDWRKCKVCGEMVGGRRRSYCSDKCAQVGLKRAHKRSTWRSFRRSLCVRRACPAEGCEVKVKQGCVVITPRGKE